ncbi:MAG: hypothetical protein ABIU09_03000 [Pyrinomonadaceae bacterium]
MKTIKKINKAIVSSVGSLLFCVFASQVVVCQTEKLGIVKYTPVKGWTKTANVENVVAFSEVNQTTGRFCIITLYGATPGTGTPQSDFTREWNNLVVKTLAAESNPKTETQAADGWTAVAGGAAVDFQGSKAIAFLTVFSGSGKTVSVLGVFNDESYLNHLTAFVAGLDMDKTAAAPQAVGGKYVSSLPSRQLTFADLAGEWAETAGFSTTYVDRYSGAYAGTDSLHYRTKMTFTRNGGYANDFFAIQNGKKIIDNTTGTFSISGRVISIRQKNTAKYVIRGWLELPDMTVLTVCGPWYGDDEIPEAIFTNPDQGANLNSNWIRKK